MGDAEIDEKGNLAWYQEAKKELEPYLQKLDLVNKSHQQYGMNFHYHWEKRVDEKMDEEWRQKVNKRMTDIFGKPLGEINTEGGRYLIEVNGRRLMTFFFNQDKEEALRAYLRALDSKINKPTGKDVPQNDKNKPTDKGKEPSKDKPIDKGNKPSRSDEVCEQCGTSCVVNQTKTSYALKKKRYIKHKTDFTRESSVWFGTNCPCAREYREANQQTCPQCKKREFPHMKKGWLLDYEIKKAFCSPLCHLTYRELKWEEAQRLAQVEMMPPELDVETNQGQNIDWEKEGLRREVLYWREYARELEQRLNNQSGLTPEERQQSNYLRNLQQNTLRNAENSYRNRYGSLSEDSPSGGGQNKADKETNYTPLIVGGCVVGGVLIIVTIALLLRKKKKHK